MILTAIQTAERNAGSPNREPGSPRRRHNNRWIRRQRLRQASLLIPARLAVRLLPMRVFEWLGELATLLFYRAVAMRREAEIGKNLQRAFGSKATPKLIENVTRQYFTNAARHWMDNVIMERDETAPHQGRLYGQHHLDEAIACGKGVILLGVHCFADRLGMRYLAHAGYPSLTVRASAGRGPATATF